MSTSWLIPAAYRHRSVAILGGGVLGRRIATCWASGGYDVKVRDPSPAQRAACLEYVKGSVSAYPAARAGIHSLGTVSAYQDVADAVKDAWLVIEAVPENLGLKIDTFAELEATAPADAILATNSSSYKSSEMLEKVSEATKARVLNTHYYMPPDVMVVELKTSGFTHPGLITFLVERHKEAGTIPYVARKESTGLIFNRLWAAVKREVLTIMAEGVSVPKEIDELWNTMFVKAGYGPCRMMDSVGLDTVAFIEEHYIAERGLSPDKTVDFLKTNYLDKGKLGAKSDKGGLYPRVPRLFVLDIGLAAEKLSATPGFVLEISGDGKTQKVLLSSVSLPDGIDVDKESSRLFWTCMGFPGHNDGAVYSAAIDGSDSKSILPAGLVNTPKQLTVEPISKKLYFSDREGMRVLRCNYDGSGFEELVKTGDWETEGFEDQTKWCVGITVAPKYGKFYWTQKGASKAGKGRIFCADIELPKGQDATNRTDIQLLLDNLPEPIDLDIEQSTDSLYWTDRGELPFGNSVNKAVLDGSSGLIASSEGKPPYQVLVRHLNEAIGLKLDVEAGHMYLTDLGGSLYRCNLDGTEKEKIYTSDNRALTGICIL